jgi:uncharacterized membrane protein
MEAIIRTGRAFYGLAMTITGIVQLYYADFRTVLIPPWPEWRLNPTLAAYVVGVIMIAAGITIIGSKWGREVALVTGSLLFSIFVFWHLPYLLFIQPHSISNLGLWAEASKALALSGGAYVVAGSYIDDQRQLPAIIKPLENLIPFGRIFFSITMIEFGIDHFLYIDFIKTLVPLWIPGQAFWTYLAGAALVAAGVAIIFRIKTKISAGLLGLVILIWFFVLHIPRAIADPVTGNGNEIVSAGDALAFSGIALLIAFLGDYPTTHLKKRADVVSEPATTEA